MNILEYTFNWLFGWHYVLLMDCDQLSICRVAKMADGGLVGKIVARSFYISPEGELTGGYGSTAFKPITWTQEDKDMPWPQEKNQCL